MAAEAGINPVRIDEIAEFLINGVMSNDLIADDRSVSLSGKAFTPHLANNDTHCSVL